MNLRTLRCMLVVSVLCDLLIGYAGFIPLSNLAAAQFTTVTGTVVDPGGLPYALGTISATLVVPGNISPTLNGSQYIAPTQARGLDRNGHFIVQLADNTVLLPAATKWNFLVCSAGGTIQPTDGKGPVCFSLASPIAVSGASQDISANLNIVARELSFLTNGAASVLRIQKASAYGVGDVGITNAISNLVGGNGMVWADYPTSQTWASCPTWGTGKVHLMLYTVTVTIAVNCTIPANVTLEFTSGAMLSPANSTTTTIVGIINAGRQQIFTNALASQGTVGFTGNLKMDRFYPEWWGAVKNGRTNDLAALQATSEAADTVGAGTVDLGSGNYFIGTGTWKIANSSLQHHLNIIGQGPIATFISSTVTGSKTAIYLNKEKYVHLEGFDLQQTGGSAVGVGMIMGGDSSGTQTNGNLMDEIIFDGFGACLGTSGSPGVGTSSEITMINLQFNNCATGFNNSSFNGLDYTFIQLQMSNNTLGINMATAGLNVFGGSSSNNGTDFRFANDGENQIRGFRSEVPTNQFVTFTAEAGMNHLTISDCEVIGLSTPNAHNAIIWAGGHLTIENCDIGGQILDRATDPGTAYLVLRNNSITDGNNTYTSTATPVGMGPGFRIDVNVAASGPRFESVGNAQFSGPGASLGFWPSGYGHIVAPQGSSAKAAVFDNGVGQGATLAITANAIQPTSYVHHVGSGLIKNISATDIYRRPSTLGSCVHLVPDAAFTTDTTGNIAKASTAVIGQVMTMCYDSTSAKWYPSY
jgi:hypothetical protein